MIKKLLIIVAMVPTIALSMLMPSARQLARIAAPVVAKQVHQSQVACLNQRRWNHHEASTIETRDDDSILTHYNAFDAVKNDEVDVASLKQQAKEYAQKERDWRCSRHDLKAGINGVVCEYIRYVGTVFACTAPFAAVEGLCALAGGEDFFFLPLCGAGTGLTALVLGIPAFSWVAAMSAGARFGAYREKKYKQCHEDAVKKLAAVKQVEQPFAKETADA